MKISSTHFTLGAPPVSGSGIGVSGEDLDQALADPIAAIIFDDAGSEKIAELLAGIGETDFQRENLQTLLDHDEEPENWRVGEAMAESLLTTHHNCLFPWPDSRDERKRKSSLPGADLVGFQDDGEAVRFAFGEVKTSSEESSPPSLMHGRHGLKKQMEDLRDSETIKKDLVKYLAQRATKEDWSELFKSACSAYLQDTCDVRLFGILVRDVRPHKDDLRARVTALSRDCPSATVIELIAVYLPEGRISSLASQVLASRREGGGG